jgi:LuxR family transcriptional regulator, maltose regulon positive regulatory protein
MIGASNTLVSTKLRFSQARPKLLARPRLIATLEREPGRKLTLISAPAGFGKTTLLVEWLRVLADGEGSPGCRWTRETRILSGSFLIS